MENPIKQGMIWEGFTPLFLEFAPISFWGKKLEDFQNAMDLLLSIDHFGGGWGTSNFHNFGINTYEPSAIMSIPQPHPTVTDSGSLFYMEVGIMFQGRWLLVSGSCALFWIKISPLNTGK